ncbi:MAG: hypothetical protein EOP08_07905, partial [Proteobacteria bacterium]
MRRVRGQGHHLVDRARYSPAQWRARELRGSGAACRNVRGAWHHRLGSGSRARLGSPRSPARAARALARPLPCRHPAGAHAARAAPCRGPCVVRCRPRMRFLYVMDPMDRIVPDKDTTYAFLRAAEARGHQSFHAVPEAVFAKAGTIGVHARQVSGFGAFPQVTTGWSTGETTVLDVASFDAVFIRKDPPFDAAYLYLSHLLDRVVDQTLVVNRPRGLRDANEKLYTLNFVQFMPTTLVASSPTQILAFVEEVGGEAVLKPLDGAGGTGVFMLRTADKNARGLIDMLTGEGRRLAMVQQFLPAVTAGDKRVLLMGGKVLGGINRISRSDDFRSNIHVGGRVEPVEVTPEERHLV